MQTESTKDVKLAIWQVVGTSQAKLWTSVFADEDEWLKFIEGGVKALRFRTGRGDAVWEVFHFDEDRPATPVGAIELGVPFWVSLRTQKSTTKEPFPAVAERKQFTKVTVGKAESEGELS